MDNPVKLIITDADDTLYAWRTSYVSSVRKALGFLAGRCTAGIDEMLKAAGEINRQLHEVEDIPGLMEGLQERFSLTKAEAKQAEAVYYENFLSEVRSSCSSRPFLHMAFQAGLPVVVVSESMLAPLQAKLRACRIDHLIEAVWCRGSGQSNGFFHTIPRFTKPDPDVLLSICREMNVLPHEVLYIGDSIAKDMVVPTQLGMRTAWCRVYEENETFRDMLTLSNWSQDDIAAQHALLADWKEMDGRPSLICYEHSQLRRALGAAGQRLYAGSHLIYDRIHLSDL